jgi:hypothetical protein
MLLSALAGLTIFLSGCGGGGGGFNDFVPFNNFVTQTPTTIFVTEPGNVGFDAFQNPSVQVQVQDAFGDVVPGVSVVLALNNFGNGGVLSGTTTQVTDQNGVATFPDLTVNKAGTYQLDAAAGGFAPSASFSFSVVGGSGSVGAPVTQSSGGTQPSGIVAADFNQNLLTDIAVSNTGASTVTVFDNETRSQGGTINLVQLETLNTGTTPVALAAQDLNQSGFPSLVTANSGSSTVSVFQNLTGTVGNQTSFNATPVTLTIGHVPVAVALGDVNGDGFPDIVTANSDGTVAIFLNTSTANGTLSFNPTPTILQTAANVALGGVAVGKLNGANDIVVTSPANQSFSVFLNGGGASPTFTEVPTTTAVTSPGPVALADFNQDGALDVVVGSTNSGGIDVFLNTAASASAITFSGNVVNNVGTGATAIQVADMNGDAVPDIEVASGGNDTVQVLLNTTSAQATATSFSGPTSFTTQSGSNGEDPVGLAVTDLNQDGLPDFVTANALTNDLSILTGQ